MAKLMELSSNTCLITKTKSCRSDEGNLLFHSTVARKSVRSSAGIVCIFIDIEVLANLAQTFVSDR